MKRVVNKRENGDRKRLLVVGMTNVDTIWKATNNLIPGGASNIANGKIRLTQNIFQFEFKFHSIMVVLDTIWHSPPPEIAQKENQYF